ncbi:MAG TPA: ligase-associated DNA damage response exonuclease [Cyclobacteriaceae bacterium]
MNDRDSLLKFTTSSIYCPTANVHIDPWTEVDYAIITHAHSDHATRGCKHYLAHKDSAAILRLRLGEDISLQLVDYGEKIFINGVEMSLHSAGHVIGSAQIRVEQKGDVWVASGDYKIEDDHFSKPFEVVKCNSFITESTFGLPVFKWRSQSEVINEINEWWIQNKIQGKTSVLMGYALGKMQRLIKNLQPFSDPVFAHGAVFNVNERLRSAGFSLPYIPVVGDDIPRKMYQGALILAPPSSLNSSWLKRFDWYSIGYCSGWMAIRAAKNSRAIDRGFVLSDHADWNALNTVVNQTGAEKVYVTHGYSDVYARWLNEQGIYAEKVNTNYGKEEEIITDGTLS